MTFLLYYFNKCFQAFTHQLDSKLQRSHYLMPTYFCLDFLFCTQYETKVTFPNLCNLTSLPKKSYCLSPMRRALPCSRINNTTSIDMKGKGQSRWPPASATAQYTHTNLGRANPLIWFHFFWRYKRLTCLILEKCWNRLAHPFEFVGVGKLIIRLWRHCGN